MKFSFQSNTMTAPSIKKQNQNQNHKNQNLPKGFMFSDIWLL